MKRHLDGGGVIHPKWIAVSVAEISITGPKTEQLTLRHKLAPRRHISLVTGEITQVGKQPRCLRSLGQVIYWVLQEVVQN